MKQASTYDPGTIRKKTQVVSRSCTNKAWNSRRLRFFDIRLASAEAHPKNDSVSVELIHI